MELHLWDMDTAWFQPQANEFMNQTFTYASWKEFAEYKPYHLWKPYVLSSWCWTLNRLQLVFISPERFTGINRVELDVTEEDEPLVRAWIQSHMPKFWKV